MPSLESWNAPIPFSLCLLVFFLLSSFFALQTSHLGIGLVFVDFSFYALYTFVFVLN